MAGMARYQRFLPARIFCSKVTKNQIPIFMTVQLFGYFLKFLSCYEFWHLVLGYFWAGWLRSLPNSYLSELFSHYDYSHSALIRNLIKLKGTAKLISQGEQVCLKDFKYILLEILENRTWKGCTNACQPSQPNCQIGLAWPARVFAALPCPIC